MTSSSDQRSGASERGEVADTIRFIERIPLFADLPSGELEDLARVMQPVELGPGELLWRQGDLATGMHVVRDGAVEISLGQPGGEGIELATLSAGEVLGEIPLLDGGTRSATARIATSARLLFLSRGDFAALTARRHPTALAVRRRICALGATRLRTRYAALADSLGPAPAPSPPAGAKPDDGASAPADNPHSNYLLRLAFFRSFAEPDLDEVLAGSRLVVVSRGRVLVSEGETPEACYVTINGAVEEVIERGEERIPVGLAGPGRAFGYLGLIDGGAAALTAATRERALLLLVPKPLFEAYFHGATATSYALFDGIERDLMTALRRNDVGFVRAVRRRRAES